MNITDLEIQIIEYRFKAVRTRHIIFVIVKYNRNKMSVGRLINVISILCSCTSREKMEKVRNTVYCFLDGNEKKRRIIKIYYIYPSSASFYIRVLLLLIHVSNHIAPSVQAMHAYLNSAIIPCALRLVYHI
jgi:hypothetical protein